MYASLLLTSNIFFFAVNYATAPVTEDHKDPAEASQHGPPPDNTHLQDGPEEEHILPAAPQKHCPEVGLPLGR